MLGFVVVWLFHCRKLACLPLAFLLLGGGAVLTYTPFKDGEDEADGEVMKFLTYNVMHMQGDTEEEGYPLRRYIQESDADVVCLQEYLWDEQKTKKVSQCIPTGVY